MMTWEGVPSLMSISLTICTHPKVHGFHFSNAGDK